jgi:outer membrane protein assembly factor BamB
VKTLSFDGLPRFDEALTQDEILGDLEIESADEWCVIRKNNFIALASFKTGACSWLVSRPTATVQQGSASDTFSSMLLWGKKLWLGTQHKVVAELCYAVHDCVKVVTRNLENGEVLWEYSYSRPALAAWAESEPAWPNAPQEEIYPFLAATEDSLVFCVHRRTRCFAMTTADFAVRSVPPFHCQTEYYCFKPTTGEILWSSVQTGVRLDILDWQCYQGPWGNEDHAGWVNLVTGANVSIRRENCRFGRPAVNLGFGYFPWFKPSQKRIGYIRANPNMDVEREYEWSEKNVRDMRVWPTSQGVAIQVNDQKVVWATHTGEVLWEQRAKPYIYKLFASDTSDIFVATDGAGGRLFGFDPRSGQETFNFRPALGGVGECYYSENRGMAVASVAMKKSHWAASKVMIFDVQTKEFDFIANCWKILGEWERGVVFVSGDKERKITFLDWEDR